MSYLALDTECTGLHAWPARLHEGNSPARPFAFSFCDEDGNTKYFRGKVEPRTRTVILSKGLRADVQRLLGTKVRKVFHNAAFDLRMLQMSGFTVRGDIEDTMIMAHVVTGGNELSYGLKTLARKWLEINDDDQKALKDSVRTARNKAKHMGWAIAPDLEADYWLGDEELCKRYAVLDAERTALLYALLREQLDEDPLREDVYRRELTLLRTLQRMEARGVRVFPDIIEEYRRQYHEEKDKQWREIQRLEPGLNPKSPKQLAHALYTKRKHPVIKRTDTGAPSCDGETLEAMSHKEPLARAILEHNACVTALSNYCDAYTSHSCQESDDVWAMHPQYRQVGTNTGRMSCVDPNMMGVASSRSGRRYTNLRQYPRRMLGPRPDHVWYLMDFSQVEVWVFAFIAQDKTMMDALLRGVDYHSYISEFVFGHEPDFKEKKEEYRKRSKMAQFCKLYGGGAKALAGNLKSTVEVAQRVIDDYDRRLPGVKQFMKKVQEDVAKVGGIRNPFGRWVAIDRGYEYRGVNYIVQGTAAEVMKDGLIAMDTLCREQYEDRVRLLLSIHDEVVVEVPRDLHSKRLMRELMAAMSSSSQRAGVPVPLPVGVKVATKNWDDVKEIKL